MAIAPLHPTLVRLVPRTSNTVQRSTTTSLPPHHRADLRDIALGVEESDAGICTRYLLDQSTIQGGEHDEGHVQLHDIERCLDRYSVFSHPAIRTWHSRMKRARRTIMRMQHAGEHHHVAVLHVAFGAEDPMTREWPRVVRDYYGAELTSLVRYTDATEERRRRLARQACSTHRAAMSGGLGELRKVVQLSEAREREAYHDRIITSGDALRDALSPRTVAERPAFLTASKRDAEGLLGAACAIYHRAWLCSL